MPNARAAEIYFIAAMMILILVISVTAVYFFFRQYNLEKRNNAKITKKPHPDNLKKEE
jgi:phosphotransferase system  glucose/maltose/N-acetylglucosamine-specific IIC component